MFKVNPRSGHFLKYCSEGNTMTKTDAEASHLWQLAHLEFHFGKTLAQRAMHGVSDPAMKSASMRGADNHIRVDDRPTAGIVEHAERLVQGTGKEEQSPKKSSAPQTRNFSTRTA
jgi:hypothetical protein